MTLKRQKGFTLIELLIVITIIGILAVALVPRLTGGQARARDAQRKADLQQIATALEFYADDDSDGAYPDTPSTGCLSALTLSSYLSTTPDDPKSASASAWGDTEVCDGNGYSYFKLSDGYVLVAGLENTNDSGDNVYDGASFAVGTEASISAVYSANTSALCSTADCTDGTSGSDNAIYVIGR